MLRTIVAFTWVATAATAAAQTTAMPQQPPPAAPPGTATVRGHVFAGDSGQPLRKAQVRIVASETRENRIATTDANGAYEFTEVRAGRYTATASKGSYVPISYGQERPTDVPKPIDVADRQLVERLDFSLPRGGVITGRIVDEFGEPLSDINMSLQRYQFVQGRRILTPTGRVASTDDLGEFRLFGVAPGQYYLQAAWRQRVPSNPGSSSPSDRITFPPTYFPGTTNVAEARRMTLAVGQQISDVAIVMKAIRAVRVSGTVTGTDGKPLSPAIVFASDTGNSTVNVFTGQTRPDGTFTLTGLGPGEYVLRSQRMTSPGDDPEIATMKIAVGGDDLDNVQLAAVKPSVAKGRVLVDPAAARQLPPTLMFALFPAAPTGGMPMPPPPPARVGDDFSFELKSGPGLMRLTLGGFGPPPAGWTIRAVRVRGVDVTDTGIEFKPNEDVADLEVELTNRIASLSGVVTNARGEVVKEYTAIVFAQDKEKWTGITRYQGTGRPDQEGRFKIPMLPPGDYYVVAVDHLEQGQSGDPDFLERAVRDATRFSLSEGETKTIQLRVTSLP